MKISEKSIKKRWTIEEGFATLKVSYKSLDFLGFSGYKVGDDGSVWSRFRWGGGGGIDENGPWRKRKFTIGLWGYFQVCLTSDSGKQKVVNVHKLVILAFIGSRPEGMECCHNNGNCKDNRVSNLRWDTPSSNQKDKMKHGYKIPVSRGESNWKTNLSNEDVLLIRKMRKDGHSIKYLAEMFGISESGMSKIASGRRWGHIK